MLREFFADFPEPPEAMKWRVKRAPGTVTLTGFRTISAAQNRAEKLAYFFLYAPFCFVLFAGFFDALVHLTFFHESVVSGNGDPLPRWVVLTVVIPFWTVGTFLAGFTAVWLVVVASRLNTERSNWELQLWENKWEVTFYRKPFFETDPSTEKWTMNPFAITALGIDAGGRVFCEEVTESKDGAIVRRVELTVMLSKAEAAWVEQALRSVLALIPSTL